ncbi:hypothetical protein IW261DRAFT_1471098 [Armillaria novae-zelandiae]|uniref:Secreted protein n=1 Tax=Armillaria novae-zelandiae TaxID=153914 RepID=A0AA39PDE2_9AGAR|nr:hypothetical protein IW261DRAFT_1471098 [Armillaria novae-zelandiae]
MVPIWLPLSLPVNLTGLPAVSAALRIGNLPESPHQRTRAFKLPPRTQRGCLIPHCSVFSPDQRHNMYPKEDAEGFRMNN